MAKEQDNEKRRCTEEQERGRLGERMWVSERKGICGGRGGMGGRREEG